MGEPYIGVQSPIVVSASTKRSDKDGTKRGRYNQDSCIGYKCIRVKGVHGDTNMYELEPDYTIIHELDDDAAITLVRLAMDALFEDREFDVRSEA